MRTLNLPGNRRVATAFEIEGFRWIRHTGSIIQKEISMRYIKTIDDITKDGQVTFGDGYEFVAEAE